MKQSAIFEFRVEFWKFEVLTFQVQLQNKFQFNTKKNHQKRCKIRLFEWFLNTAAWTKIDFYCLFSTTVEYCDSSCFEESQLQHAKRGSAKKQIWPDFYFTWSIEHIIVTTVQGQKLLPRKTHQPHFYIVIFF